MIKRYEGGQGGSLSREKGAQKQAAGKVCVGSRRVGRQDAAPFLPSQPTAVCSLPPQTLSPNSKNIIQDEGSIILFWKHKVHGECSYRWGMVDNVYSTSITQETMSRHDVMASVNDSIFKLHKSGTGLFRSGLLPGHALSRLH